MIEFPVSGTAELHGRLNFWEQKHANLSFYDKSLGDVIFHLSFRYSERALIVNHSHQGNWADEIRIPLDLNADGDWFAVSFDTPSISVLLNGAPVFSNPEFGTELDRVRNVVLQGGVVQPVLSGSDCTDLGSAHDLSLVPPLMVRALVDAKEDPTQHNFAVCLDGSHETIALTRYSSATGTLSGDMRLLPVRGLLPGRFWTQMESEKPLTLRLLKDGTDTGASLSISRDDLKKGISEALHDIDIRTETLAALQAVEHAAYAEIAVADFAPNIASALLKASEAYGIDLHEDTQPTDLPPAQKPSAGVATNSADTVRAALGLHIAETGKPFSMSELCEQVDTARLTPKEEVGLFLALTEPYCRFDLFPELFDTALKRGALPSSTASDHWTLSSQLPFLLMLGAHRDIRRGLRILADDNGQWIATPPIGWTVRAAIEGTGTTVKQQDLEPILGAFLTLIDHRSQDYWGRISCRELIRASYSILDYADRLSLALSRRSVQVIVAAFGSTPDFWSGFQDGTGTDPASHADPGLRAAYRAFKALRQDGTNGLLEPLSELNALKVVATPQLTRETLLPEAISSGPPGVSVLDAAFLEPKERDDLLLRTLAHPFCPDEQLTDPDVLRDSLRRMTPNVPRSPAARLEAQAIRSAGQFLDKLTTTGATQAVGLKDVLLDLTRISGEQSQYLGLGQMLALAHGAALAERKDVLAEISKTFLSLWTDIPPDKRSACLESAALSGPLQRIAQLHADDDITALLAIQPNPMSSLPDDTLNLKKGLPPRAGLADALVCVMSCKPYLTTRVSSLRDSWLPLLQSAGLPYLIVTGEGDDTVDGDVLGVDAPDDYQHLPQKTLRTVQWVFENTDFAHMIKIDDDCFIEPETFLEGLPFRKAHYYGRKLYRGIGQTDRSWHAPHATGATEKRLIDKSPEPSIYADGGSGYVLSRHGMKTLLSTAESGAGKMLIDVSLLEDKMVGDLMTIGGVSLNSDDYDVSVRRRTHSAGLPVGRWQNSVNPSKLSPTRLVHLDRAGDQGDMLAHFSSPRLSPPRIWPTNGPAGLGESTNAVELISDRKKLARINAADVAIVATMRNEMEILPAFLAHYRGMGVECFLIADNCSDDGTLEFLYDQPDVAVFSTDTPYSQSHYGVAWQQAIMANLRFNRWSLVADADEFLVLPGPQNQNLATHLNTPSYDGVDAVRIFMLDLYPRTALSEVSLKSGDPFSEAGYCDKSPFLRTSYAQGPFSNATTWTSALRHRLLPGSRPELFVAQKIALLRYASGMRLSAGLHYVSGVSLAQQQMIFGHFKYTAAFHEKARAEVSRGEHFNAAEEYRAYLSLLDTGQNTFYLEDKSVDWRSCEFVAKILDGETVA